MALILNSVSVWLLDFHNNDEDVDDNGDKEMGKKGFFSKGESKGESWKNIFFPVGCLSN